MSLSTLLHARGFVSSAALILGALSSAGCGGGQAAAAPADAPTSSAPADTVASAAADKTAPATVASDAPATDAKADEKDASKADAKTDAKADPDAQREVTYVVIPEGLKITVAGARFIASAQAAQVGPGWGVKVSLEATADDGKPHSLLVPKNGPLAFAGGISRKGKPEPEHFGDERGGETDQTLSGDKPYKFSRIWPAAGLRPLAIGDSLDLQVALWGLGNDKDSRRPVKQFCHVKMQVAKGKPRAIIEPPASAAGK
ncbi:MAG TPA: hypothetical protein VGM29_05570 [Polyangiaceae bacterium]|jgi:hypothetical protein